jgi:hypothetical protein
MNISDIILCAMITLIGIAGILLKLLEHRLPEARRKALDQFARIAVLDIEQKWPIKSGPDKKAMAESMIEALFQKYHMPPADQWIIDAAIEAEVAEVNMWVKPQRQTEPFRAFPSPEKPQWQ